MTEPPNVSAICSGLEQTRSLPIKERSEYMSDNIAAVCVFCGSRNGADPSHREAAHTLGTGLGQMGIHLVYGGAEIGMMGTVARAALAAGGEVTGVIPRFMEELEKPLATVTRSIKTRNMHDRKWTMYELADAFIIMPGGMGTFDETFEVITWRQLMRHNSPIVICNVGGWAKHLVGLIENAIAQEFAAPNVMDFIHVTNSVEEVLELMRTLPKGGIVADELGALT